MIGSEIIGQNFTKPEYFHPRPSQNTYDAANSGGSNLGPTNPALADRLKKDAAQFRKDNPDYTGPIPADAITASGSGLDPDISPANAGAQAAARGQSPRRFRRTRFRTSSPRIPRGAISASSANPASTS